jgi:hypothetical protein
MNALWVVGSKAVNPELATPKFGLLKIAEFVGIAYSLKIYEFFGLINKAG